MNKIFSNQEMWEVIQLNGFVSTMCNNEPSQGIDTIQIAQINCDESFGEFVGNDTVGYVFEMYKI
jgi:hypothetical protein